MRYTFCQSYTIWAAEINRWQPWRLWKPIFDHDSEIEEDVSEDEDVLEVNSESDDEENEETAIPIPYKKHNGLHPQICIRQNCLSKT